MRIKETELLEIKYWLFSLNKCQNLWKGKMAWWVLGLTFRGCTLFLDMVATQSCFPCIVGVYVWVCVWKHMCWMLTHTHSLGLKCSAVSAPHPDIKINCLLEGDCIP